MPEQPIQPEFEAESQALIESGDKLMAEVKELAHILGADTQTIYAKLRQKGLLDYDYLKNNPEFKEAIERLASGRARMEKDVPSALNEYIRLLTANVVEEQKIMKIERRQYKIFALIAFLLFLLGAGVTLLTIRTTAIALTEARKNCDEDIERVERSRKECLDELYLNSKRF